MSFKKYKPKIQFWDAVPHISINKSLFASNSACWHKYLKGVEHVELFYSADKRAIGIKPIKKKTDYSIPAIKTKNKNRSTFSSCSFISTFKLRAVFPDTQVVKIKAEWNDKKKWIVLNLPEEK